MQPKIGTLYNILFVECACAFMSCVKYQVVTGSSDMF